MGPFENQYIGVDTFTPSFEDIKVNVPTNTSPSVVGSILSNLPNIFGAIGQVFGNQAQQQPQQVRQDLTPVYLLGGAILLILLTKK